MDNSNSNTKKMLLDKLDRLKRENIDLHTYQSTFSEIDSMDCGPRVYESTEVLNHRLYNRIQNLNKEIEKLEEQINQLE